MNGFVEEFDWFDEIDGQAEPIQTRRSRREDLKAAVLKIAEIQTVEGLEELQGRVAQALDNIKAAIDTREKELEFSSDTAADLKWVRNARFAENMFSRAMRQIDGRKKSVRLAEEERKREIKREQNRKLNDEQQALADRKRQQKQEDLMRRAEAAKALQEEKSRRQAMNRNRNLKIDEKVRSIILQRNLIPRNVLVAIYREAEEMVDAEAGDGEG